IEVSAQLAPQERLNQNLGLAGAARAQFHQSQIVAGMPHHVAGVSAENRPLRPRRIVLRGLRDLVEEARAFFVVKKFRRKLAPAPAEPTQNFIRDGTDQYCPFVNCRHLPALCRRMASACPGERSYDTWREYGSGAWRTSHRAAPFVRS